MLKLETRLHWAAGILFAVLMVHGATLGLSDDEAYYWVLAQQPAMSYAFHPPMVAWWIAAVEKLFGNFNVLSRSGLVRLPAALVAAGVLELIGHWWISLGMKSEHSIRSILVLLSFFGFFSLSWMMVPDSPLILYWTLLFYSLWALSFKAGRKWHYWAIVGASAGVVLSKYSGILAVLSGFACTYFFIPQTSKKKVYAALFGGLLLASIPIIIWNANHEWGSILYQIRDRHQGADVSWMRFLRFYLIQLCVLGPIGVVFIVRWIWKYLRDFKKLGNQDHYLAIWIAPALVFAVQPLFSDFKPHWILILWWPFFIGFSLQAVDLKVWRWARYHVMYGLSMSAIILLGGHIPFGGWLIEKMAGHPMDPRLDVTHDLYGWPELRARMSAALSQEDLALPVIGSRYQTASQAAFSLGGIKKVTLIPRDLKAKDEWLDLGVTDSSGPAWPNLLSPVLFVADNRYSAPPEFKGAECKSLKQFEFYRGSQLAKWIQLWKCTPVQR